MRSHCHGPVLCILKYKVLAFVLEIFKNVMFSLLGEVLFLLATLIMLCRGSDYNDPMKKLYYGLAKTCFVQWEIIFHI